MYMNQWFLTFMAKWPVGVVDSASDFKAEVAGRSFGSTHDKISFFYGVG